MTNYDNAPIDHIQTPTERIRGVGSAIGRLAARGISCLAVRVVAEYEGHRKALGQEPMLPPKQPENFNDPRL